MDELREHPLSIAGEHGSPGKQSALAELSILIDQEARYVRAAKELRRYAESCAGQLRTSPDRKAPLAHAAKHAKLWDEMQAYMGKSVNDLPQQLTIGEPYPPCTLPLKDLEVVMLSN